jgi:hypothetical protein
VEIKESEESGIYRLELNGRKVESVVLFDHAHNRTIISVPR